jgi:hypothetical protein
MSWHPNSFSELASASMMTEDDRHEETYIQGIIGETEKMFAFTWESVKRESERDASMCLLSKYFCKDLPEFIRCFWDVR